MRVAPEQPGREHHVHERVAIAGNKTVAARINGLAELARTRERFVHKRLRMKSPVLPLGGDGCTLGVQRAGHVGIGEPAGDVHPAIGPERGAGHAELFAAALGAETGEHHAPHIRAPIAGGVLEIPNIRRARQKDAALPQHHAIGKRKPLGKRRALLKPPVAIHVLQQRHRAQLGRRFPFAILRRQKRIPAPFHHKHPPRVIKTHRHRILHLRFRRRQFHSHALFNLKRLERLRGHLWRGRCV